MSENGHSNVATPGAVTPEPIGSMSGYPEQNALTPTPAKNTDTYMEDSAMPGENFDNREDDEAVPEPKMVVKGTAATKKATKTPVKPTTNPKRRIPASDGAAGEQGGKKKKKAAPKRKSTGTLDDDNSEDEGTPIPPTRKRQRKTAENIAASKPIGRSYEECESYDKMLHDWREKGKSWEEIQAKWTQMTGQDVGNSTLPNRYNRLKSNFAVVKEEDHEKLLNAKREIEARFEKEKWHKIADEVVERGGDEYKADVLQRQYKKLMVRAGVTGPSEADKRQGVVDKDFDIYVSPEDMVI